MDLFNDIERFFLAYCFHRPELLDTILDNFKPRFLVKDFQAIKRIHEKGISVDPFIVSQEMHKQKSWEFYDNLVDDFAIFDIHKVNQIYGYYHDFLIKERIAEAQTFDEILEATQEIDEQRKRIEPHDKKLYDMITEVSEDMQDSSAVFETGIVDIDKLIQLRSKNLMVLAAPPKTGKSAMALNMVMNNLRNDKKVIFFSFEMTSNEILKRLGLIYKGYPYKDASELTQTLLDFERKYKDKFILIEDSGYSVSQIKIKCSQIMPDIIFIDQLDCLPVNMMIDRHDIRIGNNVMALKKLSQELNIPIVLLHQLNRSSQQSKEPESYNLKDSQVVEQKADQVLLLWHDKNLDSFDLNGNKTETIMAKISANRHGDTGTTALLFRKKIQTFVQSSLKTE